MLAVFKKMPTHQKLGQWLQEHHGQHFGTLVLHGKFSTHKKAWGWRVIAWEKLAPPSLPEPAEPPPRVFPHLTERQEARLLNPKPAPTVAELQAKTAESYKRLQRDFGVVAPPRIDPVTAVVVMPPDSKPPVLETVRVDRDGKVTRTPILGRNGEPLKEHKLEPAYNPADRRPPWLQRGELKARDRAEWQAWQHKDTGFATERPVTGFADPGGVVSGNIQREYVDSGRRWSQDL